MPSPDISNIWKHDTKTEKREVAPLNLRLAAIGNHFQCFHTMFFISGGALLDLCGYPWATQFMVLVLVLTALTTIVYSPDVVVTREGIPLV